MRMGHTTSNHERNLAACEQRWLLASGFGLEPKQDGPKAPWTGKLWHQIMESFWSAGEGRLGRLVELPRRTIRLANTSTFIHEVIRPKIAESVIPEDFDPQTAMKGVLTKEEAGEMLALFYDMLRRYSDFDAQEEAEHGVYKVLGNEDYLKAAPPTASGNPSTWSQYGGFLDKLVQDWHGQWWIWDHKLRMKTLAGWREQHEYNPQTPGYAWLVWKVFGVMPVGVIFDLALAKSPPSWRDLKVVKAGDRFAKNGIPTGTTSKVFVEALQARGFSLHDQPWYREKLSDLKEVEQGFYFHREPIRFDTDEIMRSGEELYHVATRIRRLNNRIERHRSHLYDVWTTMGEEPARALALQVYRQISPRWPRNHNECYTYNRPCEFMDLCQYRTTEALDGMRFWRIERQIEKEAEKSAQDDLGSPAPLGKRGSVSAI